MAERDALTRARELWEARAKQDWLTAIMDTAATADADTRDAAFDATGRDHARLIAWFVHPAARVLDLGCGVGRVIRHLAPLCREVVGVDISEEMLREARSYLRGSDNVELRRTDGASLSAFPDHSFDFVYSLLCLIHVDRRSAFLYMREIRRVLRGGLALLQFLNILTEGGQAKFEEVLGKDCPLEFYTEAELRWLLQRAGLSTLTVHPSDPYLFFTVCDGSAEAWVREIREGLAVTAVEASGAFAAERSSSRVGCLRGTLRSRLAAPRTFAATITITRAVTDGAGQSIASADAIVVVPPGGSCELAFQRGADGELKIQCDGRAPTLTRSARADASYAGPAHLHVGLLPSGFFAHAHTHQAFPNLFYSREIDWCA